MSSAGAADAWEVVVPSGDPTIPADELARHGLRPGEHLRLVRAVEPPPHRRTSVRGILAGTVSHVPTWEDFEAAHRDVVAEIDRRYP